MRFRPASLIRFVFAKAQSSIAHTSINTQIILKTRRFCTYCTYFGLGSLI